MHIVRIEHPVPDFDAWKKAFDSNPLHRRQAGVRRYRVMRLIDDPNYVMIDLEFDTLEEAQAMLASLHRLWGEVEGKLIKAGKAQIAEITESAKLYA